MATEDVAQAMDDRTATVLRLLSGYMVMKPIEPVAFVWVGGHLVEKPAEDFTDDDSDDGGFIVRGDEYGIPTIENVVGMILHDLDELADVPARWRYWRISKRLLSKLYVLGVVKGWATASGGPHGQHGSYVSGRVSWSFFRGPYALGKQDWWWSCLRRQGFHLRGRHRPIRPWAFGICAACVPCSDCGAPYACADDCAGDCCADYRAIDTPAVSA